MAKKSNSAMNDLKNRVRALIAGVRRHIEEDNPKNRATNFHVSLVKSMLIARKSLDKNDYKEFISWSKRTIGAQINRSVAEISDYGTLNFVTEGFSASLETEIAWITARIQAEAPLISAFRGYANKIETLIWNNRGQEAITILDLMHEDLEPSIWGIELRIGLEQHSNGLESQKAFSKMLKEYRYLIAILSHYYSVRNEPWISIEKYNELISERVSKLRTKDKGLKIWYEYKLTGVMPDSDSAMSEILRVEQSHSIIDIYETFIDVIQHKISKDKNGSFRKKINQIMDDFSEINDSRLEKIRLHTAPDQNILRIFPQDSAVFLDSILDLDVNKCVKKTIESWRKNKNGSESVILLGLSICGVRERSEKISLMWNLGWSLSRILRREPSYIKDRNDFRKITLNLSTLPSFKALDYFAILLDRAKSYDILEALTLCSLNNRMTTFLDFFSSSMRVPNASWAHAIEELFLFRPSIDSGLIFRQENDLTKLRDATLHFVNKRYSAALDILSPLKKSNIRPIQVHAIILSAQCLSITAKIGNFISDAATIAVESEYLWRMLPAQEMLGDIEWDRIEPYADDISLAIILDFDLRSRDDADQATHRRWALEDFLKRNGITKPSDLVGKVGIFEKTKIVHLLRFTCVPSVIDMLPTLPSERAVDEERLAICAALRKLDPVNDDHYHSEILQISRRLTLLDALKIVDSHRLYVDEEDIANWARRELEEPLGRFRDIIESGIDIGADAAEIQEILLAADKEFFVPDNEADEILASLLLRMRTKFLSDPIHGLDAYISKRIRHHVFATHMRGPVDATHLITKRENTGRYGTNTYWLDKLELNPKQARRVRKLLSEFSRDFDNIIGYIVDNIFHIKSASKPKGKINLNVNTKMFFLMRSLIIGFPNIDYFIILFFNMSWLYLEGSLQELRSYLTHKTKESLLSLFEKLSLNLEEDIKKSPARAELLTAVRDTSVAVQSALEAAASWFKRSDLEQAVASKNLSLDRAIETALTAIQAAHHGKNLKISKHIEPARLARPEGIIPIMDIIWIAVGNALERTGEGETAIISLAAQALLETKTAKFVFLHQVKTGAITLAAQRKLELIKSEIASRSYERVRTEGGSGLLKLASMVDTNNGSIDFGFKDERWFYIDMIIPLDCIEDSGDD